LFATDGIFDNLTKKEMEKIIASTPVKQLPETLIYHAQEVSEKKTLRSKSDDMTVIVVNTAAIG